MLRAAGAEQAAAVRFGRRGCLQCVCLRRWLLSRRVPGLVQKGNACPSHCHLQADSPVFTPLCRVTEISQPFGLQFLTCFFFALNSLQFCREWAIVIT